MDNSKQQAKKIPLRVQSINSSFALLKRIKALNGIHVDEESDDILAKLFIERGKKPIYPNKPFKHNYMRIPLNNDDIIKNCIGFGAPLTDQQVKIVSNFVGIEAARQSKSDMEYLKTLKALLIQRCNVQNPDELDWDDILTHLELFSQKTKQKAKLDDDIKTKNIEKKLSPAKEKAYQSYEFAISQNPQLAENTDKAVYDWLKENGIDEYPLPSFETWQRYLRTGRMHYGTSKNTPRAGRTLKTSISVTDPSAHQITSKLS